jgi:uncharacterized protein involved in exopolysaccharide biosynthesis
MSDVESQHLSDSRLAPNEEVNLAPYVAQIIGGGRTIGLFVIAGVIAGLITAYTVSPVFTAESSFLLPSSSGGGAAAIAAQLGNVGGASGLLGLGKSPGDMLVGVLQSHSVLQTIVERFNLKEVFHAAHERDAEVRLVKETTFGSGTKDSIVTIAVTDTSPTRARDLANGYLDALQQASENFALTESSQRRVFYEKRLEQEKEALADAEVNLKKTQEKTGLVLPASQATLQLDEVSKLRAEITGREVQLASLREAATDQNSQVIRLKSEIADLNRQLGAMENGDGATGSPALSRLPELGLEEVRMQREVKYHETLFDIIAKQYEAARMDESKVGPTLQVLDRATLPESKSGPSRSLILLGFSVTGFFLGIFAVLFLANRAPLMAWYQKTFVTVA